MSQLWTFLTLAGLVFSTEVFPAAENSLSCGPLLGNISSNSVRVWVRTRNPGSFRIVYSTTPDFVRTDSSEGRTSLDHDNTGFTQLTNLIPDTRYYYDVRLAGQPAKAVAKGSAHSFRTLPDAPGMAHPKLNPSGLFNFAFEYGCGNRQISKGGKHPVDPPVYGILKQQFKDDIKFHIVNGDWLYEEKREFPVSEWSKAVGTNELPGAVRLLQGRPASSNFAAPKHRPDDVCCWTGITGVWENYKLYLKRGVGLSSYHAEVPGFFTFDDHEILNDALGGGETGFREDATDPAVNGHPFRSDIHGVLERAVFRDPALHAWQDYLGWANPDIGVKAPIRFGMAGLSKGQAVLVDSAADFTSLDTAKTTNLHIRWGYKNTGVYEIVKVLDSHRLQINPPAAASEAAPYSIGTNQFSKFTVSNCDFYLLDCRSMRSLQGSEKLKFPNSPGTMLGRRQKNWLKKEMEKSPSRFLFVVSSVNFMIPHTTSGHATAQSKEKDKDDAWTAHVKEREEMIRFFQTLNKNVFILTGDLHNSFAIKVAPGLWEFASGPHNSPNHWQESAGGAPMSGPYDSFGRKVQIRWSTGYLSDRPTASLFYPTFCVVRISNCYNSPDQDEKTRWVAYPAPYVTFEFRDGRTGELKYAESVSSAELPDTQHQPR